jgi:predicted ATP-grasp superfamily ATP-dependent carboligase
MKELETLPFAVVGASARAAAFSVLRTGFAPLAADLFADADLVQCAQAERVERYPHGLLDWLRTTPPNTFWMYTGALENHPDLVDEMAKVRLLAGCRGEALRRVRDPLELAKLLTDVDVAFPETMSALSPLPLPAHQATLSPLPLDGGGVGGGGERAPTRTTSTGNPASWLLKTYRGSSGSGVRVWDGARPHDASAPFVLQRRIEGTPGSAVFLGGAGKAALLATTHQLVGTPWTYAGAFQYAGSIGPWRLDEAAEIELLRAAGAIAQAGVVGLFGVDFVKSDADGRPCVVEVNPRYTASVEIAERLIDELPIIAMHVTAAHFGRAPYEHAPRLFPSIVRKRRIPVFGKAILFAPQEITVTQAFTDWTRTKATGPPWPQLADLPQTGSRIAEGRPVLTVFAEGATYDEVEHGLQLKVQEVLPRLT